MRALLGGIVGGVESLLEHLVDAPKSLLHELGSSLRNVIDGVADPEKGLVHAIGDAAATVIDSGGDAVKKVEEGAGDMIFKNIGSIIVVGILVLLGIFLFLRYKGVILKKSNKQRHDFKDGQEMIEMYSPRNDEIYTEAAKVSASISWRNPLLVRQQHRQNAEEKSQDQENTTKNINVR